MNRSNAFTLLEVLVALAVVAIALAAAMKIASENVRNAQYLRDRTLAHWVAMNVITEVQVRGQWLSIGKTEDKAMMAEREWFWRLQVLETADKPLRRLEVTVYYTQKRDQPIAQLVGFIGKY
jgi:general secretion pathway protein I